MTDIESRKAAIKEQVDKMNRAMYMVKRISKYPEAKKLGTKINRAFRMAAYAMEAYRAARDARIIQSQPIKPSEGLPVVGHPINN